MKKYNCIFPGLYNYILTKDVGMIPYTLTKYYNTTITTYNNDKYTYLTTTLNEKPLTLDYLENSDNERKDVVKYIKNNAKQIDIIQFYHLRYNQLPLYILIYKLYNRQGKIYLKLDANNQMIDFLTKRKGILPKLRRYITHLIFKPINIISIETKRNYEALKKSKITNKNQLIYLPNGISKDSSDVTCKEKIILYVGYIQKENKSIDVLLNAVENIDLKDWKIYLIGEVQPDIKNFIEKYFEKNPKLKDKVIFKGYISDKKQLATEYAKSSVYCSLSKKESFGISILEAAYHSNYIISTDVGCVSDLIEKTKYGKIVQYDLDTIENTIKDTISNWDTIKENPIKIQEIVYDNYNWDYLCSKLNRQLEL